MFHENRDEILCLRNLSVGYGKIPVHKNVSFSVKKGEIVCLIGPNGSGKSTILRTLIRQLRAIDGTVFLDSTDLSVLSQKELSRKMSVLLTNRVRPELFSCRDVVSSGRYPHTGYFGHLGSEDERAVDEAIFLVRGEEFAGRDFMRVSDGQKQRILLARALCQNPKVLVLDEPTSYLDIKWRFELLEILRKLSQKGVTIISSLHEIDLALKVSDRIFCVGSAWFSELAKNEEECKKQILSLYDLNEDFFETEAGYAAMVRKFCGEKSARL